jgi:hypothetical protein
LPGLGRGVRRPPGNPRQGEGQQGAAIGDDKKPLLFDDASSNCELSVVSCRLPGKSLLFMSRLQKYAIGSSEFLIYPHFKRELPGLGFMGGSFKI